MIWPQLAQYQNIALFVLRAAIAAIFIYHAMPKLKAPEKMAEMMGSKSFVVMIGLVEVVASLSLVFGIYEQVGALLLSIVMIGAMYYKMVKWEVPFSSMEQIGWEFDLILLAGNIVILTVGGGAILQLVG